MYIVSPFTPLFFNPSTDTSGINSRYIQVFSPSDEIMLQVITRSESRTITGKIIDVITGTETDITWSVWSLNSTDKLYYKVITDLNDSYYQIDINGNMSNVFRVTSDVNELADTTLIQYSMKDNKDRQDVVFWISEIQHFFDFRVHGGFKDEDWSFGVENEQFTDANYNMCEVYSHEKTNKTFTMGNSCGCPVWFAELLNRILSCSHVYFNGERYMRLDSSTPEMSILMEGYKGYVFKQALTATNFVDYSETENLLKIRRVGNEDTFRKISNKLLTV